MKKRILIYLMAITAVMCVFCGCSQKSGMYGSAKGTVTFEDDLGRTVTVESAERVGIASGSFAECWMLAGGTPAAVTQDAWQERDLGLPEETIDMGALRSPSTEVILSQKLDFVILVSTLDPHLALDDTLTQAGIPHAYMNIETFDDYLRVMKTFTEITDREDLYEKNGEKIKKEVDEIIASSKLQTSPKVLVLRASGTEVAARNSETMVGQMLKNMGCVNIADHEESLLDDLSMEIIAEEDPEYIFVICRGDAEEAEASMEDVMLSNPVWHTLDAVKNNRCYYLDKELFHYKPTVRWGESYEVLAGILSEDK